MDNFKTKDPEHLNDYAAIAVLVLYVAVLLILFIGHVREEMADEHSIIEMPGEIVVITDKSYKV